MGASCESVDKSGSAILEADLTVRIQDIRLCCLFLSLKYFLLSYSPAMLVEELKTLREGILPLELDPLRAAIRGESVPDDFPHQSVYKCPVAGIR